VDETAPELDPDEPGIYEWRIEGVGVYVGQYTRRRRPQRAYGVSVENCLNGRTYRRGKPFGFRVIHLALARAVARRELGEEVRITLAILENVSDKLVRNRRERELIEQRHRESGQDGPPILNSGPKSPLPPTP